MSQPHQLRPAARVCYWLTCCWAIALSPAVGQDETEGGPTAGIAAAAAPLVVRIPKPDRQETPDYAYFPDLLDLALKATEGTAGAYRIEQAQCELDVRHRSIRFLENGRFIDLIWALESPERNRALRAVPHPLLNGFAGYRLLIVRRADTAAFTGIVGLEDLQRLTAGALQDSLNGRILGANGLPTVEGRTYKGIFGMLRKQRFDYLAHGICQADADARSVCEDDLAIEPDLLLHYPAVTCFYVKADNGALAQRLLAGLRTCQEDGSMAKLFDRHFGELVKQVKNQKRTVIELENPFLSSTGQEQLARRDTALATRKAP